jgi:hypothetical protein
MPKGRGRATATHNANGSLKRTPEEIDLDRYLIDCIRAFQGKNALYASPNEQEHKMAALKRSAEQDREKNDYYSVSDNEELSDGAE